MQTERKMTGNAFLRHNNLSFEMFYRLIYIVIFSNCFLYSYSKASPHGWLSTDKGYKRWFQNTCTYNVLIKLSPSSHVPYLHVSLSAHILQGQRVPCFKPVCSGPKEHTVQQRRQCLTGTNRAQHNKPFLSSTSCSWLYLWEDILLFSRGERIGRLWALGEGRDVRRNRQGWPDALLLSVFSWVEPLEDTLWTCREGSRERRTQVSAWTINNERFHLQNCIHRRNWSRRRCQHTLRDKRKSKMNNTKYKWNVKEKINEIINTVYIFVFICSIQFYYARSKMIGDLMRLSPPR